MFCPVLTWQRRGFRVRSGAAVASTSLPALRDRSIGVKRGQNPNIGVEAAVSKLWGEKRTKPKHWGFPDYYPFTGGGGERERERESSSGTTLTMQKGGENMAISRMSIHIFAGKGRLQEPHTPRFSSGDL